MVIRSDYAVHIFALNSKLPGSHFLLTSHGCCKGSDIFRISVIDAFKILSAANRPVDRTRFYSQNALYLIHQFKRIPGLAVHLVNKRKNRDIAQKADFKQLDRLRLDTLRRIDYHNGGIGSHQGSVRILREVLMARCVQDIDAVSVIIKLQYRRGD